MKKQDDPKNNKKDNSKLTLSRLAPIFLGVVLGSVALQSLKDNTLEEKEVSYGELVEHATQGQVSEITLRGREITATLKAGGEEEREVTSYVPAEENAFERFNNEGVNVTAKPVERGGFASFLFAFGPVLIIVGAIAYLMNKQMGAGGLTKSPAKLLDENSKKVTFDDVAGIDEAKTDLKELVGFLKDPDKYSRLGGAMPKGALLIGPPGTGKTLIARAVAGEADVPFYRTSGSDFVEMYAGRGAGRVREMFAEAKKKAPCIIFIDEIDAIGGKRGSGAGGGAGHNEREQTLNQLLVEMDGFEGNEGVVIIAATNRPDTLDDALMRPGRFDRQVTVPAPDMRGRMQILEVHMKKIPHLADDVSIHNVAIGTPGFSGAELANLVNEAALTAVRNDHDAVYMSDFEDAKDKIMMGAELSSLMMSKKEKELTAYHEAGHALMAILQEESDPIHKATIIPRGRALGMVMRLPENDRVSITKAKLNADLIVAMGGRIAEELHTGTPDKVTTGASGDIQQATEMARKMVTEWGFSEKLGRVRYAEEQNSFTKKFSEATSKLVDDEVKRIVEEAYETAKKLMTDNEDKLENIAQALIDHETLTGEEVKIAADGGKIERSVPRKYQASNSNNAPQDKPSSHSFTRGL